MRKHASSDGSGDKDTINWREYAKGFLIVTGDGKHFGDYHYPDSDIKDGHMVTSWGGVKAAASRIEQNLTGPELHSAQHHLGEHYREFGKTPPWEHKPAQTQLDDAGAEALTLLDDAAGAVSIPLPKIGAPPPKRIRLFKWGWNDTTKGSLKLDQAGADATMAAFRKRGVAQTFDLWHSTFDQNVKPEDKKTVGTYLLELEGSEASGVGGLFASECQFSPDVAREISEGKWPYASPVPMHTKDGRIVDVKNTALVGLPATHNAQPLLMSLLSALPPPPKKEHTKMSMSTHMKTCMAKGQHFMAALKAAADHGEASERETANEMLSAMGPHMQKMMGHAGEHADKMKKEMADDEAMEMKRCALLAALEAEFGTKDPEVIEGKVLALQTKTADAAKTERTAVLKLLADNTARIPPARMEGLKAKSLTVVQTYLDGLGEPSADQELPRGALNEKKPATPSAEEVAKLKQDTENKSLTLADLSMPEQAALEATLTVRRGINGEKFDAGAVTTAFLSELKISRKGA